MGYTMARWFGLAVVISAVPISGCAFLLDTDGVQCRLDGDCPEATQCEGGLCVAQARFSCPIPEPTVSELMRIVEARRATTQAPLEGVTVRACRRLDVTCANPIGEVVTDEQGQASLTIPVPTRNNEVFFEYVGEGFVPLLSYPADDILTTDVRADLVTPLELGTFMTLAGLTWDQSQGFINSRVIDCLGVRVEGVVLTINQFGPGTSGWYFADDAISTDPTATDDSGRGGFTVVPIGQVTLTGRLEENGQLIDSRSGFTRAEWMSDFTLSAARREGGSP